MQKTFSALTALVAAAILGGSTGTSAQRDDSKGLLPPMGWNSYNAYGCAPNEERAYANLNALKSRGLVKAGYTLFTVDCGWQASFRNESNGAIAIVEDRFPNGFQKLADDTRAAGMQWGMYTDLGLLSCDTDLSRGAIGSLGYEKEDAAFFASLGAVSVKVDNCFVDGINNAPKDPATDFVSRYSVMRKELKANGIGGMEVCQWGVPYSTPTGLQGPAEWTRNLSTLFRLSDDIANDWISVVRISNQAMHIVNKGLTGPKNWADADMLEVGNDKLTFEEQKTHFTLWAALKSPLFISTDLSKATDQTISILRNKDVIAINQDSKAEPVKLVQRFSNAYDLYQGDLAGGDQIILLVEQGNQKRKYKIDFDDFDISRANAHELWSDRKKTRTSSFSGTVEPHGVVALRLSNVREKKSSRTKITYFEAEDAQLSDGAVIQDCAGCSGKKNVGYVGKLTFSKIPATRRTQTVYFDYINGNIPYIGRNDSGAIGAQISVNGGQPQEVFFPLTGYNWAQDVWKKYKVELKGFRVGSRNTISISGGHYLSQYAPDIDRIGIARS